MAHVRIAITLDEAVLGELDRLVARRAFPNRSQAIQEAVTEKLHRLAKRRLEQECAKLDPTVEKALAEEGISANSRKRPAY